MSDDAALLRRYAEHNSEEAFAELVQRHVSLVYATALRKANGQVHRAEDITQSVFTDLARKAALLSRRTTLAGWLYLSTHHAAAELRRGEQRRQAREQEAYTMQEISHDPTPAIDWDRVQPVLDEILRKLNDLDRDAVLLRFFEQRSFAEIGATLRVNEDTARKRVDRSLDKLRANLASRGITSTVGALTAALASNSAMAAPAGLATKVSATAVATTAASGKIATSFPVWFAAHLKAGLFGIVLLAGAAAVVVQQYTKSEVPDAPAIPPPAEKFAPAPDATSRAIIVIGLTADPTQAERFRQQAETARRGFIARGIPPSSIQLLANTPDANLSRDTVLAAIRDTNPQRQETWVLLLGHAAKTRNERPAYQVSGPRLLPEDLAAAIATLPGKKFVIVSTALSGGFLPPLLALPNVEALSATAADGEVNEPRFGAAWPAELLAHPQASFSALATGAAKRVEAFYREKSLGQSEHARLIDRPGNAIVEISVPSPASSVAATPSATH